MDKEFYGRPEAKKKYVVLYIDEDTEDSTFSFCRADDEEELEAINREGYFGEDEEEYEGDADGEWTEAWGFTILYSEIPNN